MDELLSVEKCEDEPSHDPRYRHCFEVNTQGRGYLFSAETESELEEWVATFQKIISSDAADNLVPKLIYARCCIGHAVSSSINTVSSHIMGLPLSDLLLSMFNLRHFAQWLSWS